MPHSLRAFDWYQNRWRWRSWKTWSHRPMLFLQCTSNWLE